MSVRISDPVFLRDGQPAKVIGSNATTGKLTVDSDLKQVTEDFRHGYIKGLVGEPRQEFDSFMDNIASIEDPKEKVELLQKKILDLEENISPLSQKLVGYYKAELSHIMHSYNTAPRYFTIPSYRNI